MTFGRMRIAHRTRIWASALFLGGLCFVPAAWAGEQVDSGQFDQVTSISAPRLTMRYVETITFKGTRIRVDRTDPTQFIDYTEIEDGLVDWSYVPSQETAIKTDLKAKGPSLLVRMKEQTAAMVKGAVKSGTDTVLGMPCTVYKMPLPGGGGGTLQFWVSRDPKFPFVVKNVATSDAQGVVRTMQIQKIQLNSKVDDAQFALPPGTKVVAGPGPGEQGGPNGLEGAAPTGKVNMAPPDAPR